MFDVWKTVGLRFDSSVPWCGSQSSKNVMRDGWRIFFPCVARQKGALEAGKTMTRSFFMQPGSTWGQMMPIRCRPACVFYLDVRFIVWGDGWTPIFGNSSFAWAIPEPKEPMKYLSEVCGGLDSAAHLRNKDSQNVCIASILSFCVFRGFDGCQIHSWRQA